MASFYKIRRRSDDLFSTGGRVPNWKATGKIWHSIHHLRAHLRGSGIARRTHPYSPYKDADVVEFEAVEVDHYPVGAEIEATLQRHQELQKKRELQEARAQEEHAKREIERARAVLKKHGVSG